MSNHRLHFDATTLFALLKMSVPMVISQGAFAVMLFTDRYFLAQLSPLHMAAVLGGGVAWYFSFSLFNGILAYANALVAQYLGAKQLHKCSKVVSQGILMSCACIPMLFIITLLMRNIFAAMGHTPEQIELEKSYYSILMYCSFLTLLKVCMASFFSGIGRTSVVMICDLAGILLNIPLCYILVFGKFGLPAMGIEGAAWATFISTLVTLLFFFSFYLTTHNRKRFEIGASFLFEPGITRRYIRLGFPSGMELFLNVAAFNLFLLMFQSYGIPEAAAATIVFNWDVLSFVPLLGLNIATMSLIGNAVGSGNMEKTSAVITAGYVLGLGYSLVLATVYFVYREPLVDVFIFGDVDTAAIRELTRFMMIGLSCYVLCEGALQVATGVLRGAGDTRWIMIASVSLHWLMLLSQFLIIKVFDLGPRVSWIGFVITILAIALVFLLRLSGNRWRDPARLQALMAE